LFSRQRYWGEPFPIYYDQDGIIHTVPENQLPVTLPKVESYKPTGTGESPLATATEWVTQFGEGTRMETDTMPGYAGSSWYFLRYMDPQNENELVSAEAQQYWQNVDFYVGGSEHAVGHLLYSRFWHKFLKDIGKVSTEEPFQKMVNQGMIQGVSKFVYRYHYFVQGLPNEQLNLDKSKLKSIFVSKQIKDEIEINNSTKYIGQLNGLIQDAELDYKQRFSDVIGTVQLSSTCLFDNLHVDIKYVNSLNNSLDYKRLIEEDINYKDAIFLTEEDGNYYCGSEVEKMSKSKFNVVNPDQIIEQYGADTFRMYEMFLGPVELSKPWDTKGIEGVHRFLKKFWRLFADELKGLIVTNEAATPEELKVLHRTIKKIEDDTERFSFNTAVSGFMIATNELTDLKCHKRSILEPLLVLITPYAPHIAAELWSLLGHTSQVLDAAYPVFDPKQVVESSKEYPISINGKLRTTLDISLAAAQSDVEALVLANEVVQKWLEGKAPKKIIFVKGKMVNIVI